MRLYSPVGGKKRKFVSPQKNLLEVMPAEVRGSLLPLGLATRHALGVVKIEGLRGHLAGDGDQWQMAD